MHETHLIFRGHKASIDQVTMLDDSRYISGGQDGSLCLWKDTQKKPLCTHQASHGLDDSGISPKWVCSLAALKMTDVFASGSYDGVVRLWQADTEKRRITETLSVEVGGIVNALALSSDLIVAGTGRDHKYGKWFQDKTCGNEIVVMKLPVAMAETSADMNDDEDMEEFESEVEDSVDGHADGMNDENEDDDLNEDEDEEDDEEDDEDESEEEDE
jgi:WD40 repeat protein